MKKLLLFLLRNRACCSPPCNFSKIAQKSTGDLAHTTHRFVFFLLLLFISATVIVSDPIHAQTVNYQFDYSTDTSTSVETQTQTAIQGEHIQDFKSDVVIEKSGIVQVTETIVYDFGQTSHHGIYRYIPYTKVDTASDKRYRMKLSNFSVTDENGKKYTYQMSDDGSQQELKIGDADRTITGVHTYVIKYTVSGALGYSQDHDELYWNTTGTGWDYPIAHASSHIVLPSEITIDQIKVICYTGPAGSTAQNCQTAVKGNEVTIDTNSFLNSDEGMTFAVSFPKNIVAVLQAEEIIPFWKTPLGQITKVMLIIGGFLWYLVFPLWVVYQWFKHGRDPKVDGPVRAWFDPPKNAKGDAITPAETGALVDETVDMKDVIAMIISLAQRGYLQIVQDKNKKFTLVEKKSADAKLLPFEKNFLNSIFESDGEVQLDTGEIADEVSTAKSEIYKQLVTDGFFREDPNKIRTIYVVIGALAATTLNLFLFFASFIFGRNMAQKTLLGAQQSSVAKSLKNFLTSQERQLEFQSKNQMMFEKLLPFAVAFGVEKIWADRFKDIALKQPEWYQGYYTGSFNSTLFSNSLHSSFASSMNSASTVPSSTGSGFSGGSSGGGGGGGGGGSW